MEHGGSKQLGFCEEAPLPAMGDGSHKMQVCSSLHDMQVFACWRVSSDGELLIV